MARPELITPADIKNLKEQSRAEAKRVEKVAANPLAHLRVAGYNAAEAHRDEIVERINEIFTSAVRAQATEAEITVTQGSEDDDGPELRAEDYASETLDALKEGCKGIVAQGILDWIFEEFIRAEHSILRAEKVKPVDQWMVDSPWCPYCGRIVVDLSGRPDRTLFIDKAYKGIIGRVARERVDD